MIGCCKWGGGGAVCEEVQSQSDEHVKSHQIVRGRLDVLVLYTSKPRSRT